MVHPLLCADDGQGLNQVITDSLHWEPAQGCSSLQPRPFFPGGSPCRQEVSITALVHDERVRTASAFEHIPCSLLTQLTKVPAGEKR